MICGYQRRSEIAGAFLVPIRAAGRRGRSGRPRGGGSAEGTRDGRPVRGRRARRYRRGSGGDGEVRRAGGGQCSS